MFNYLACWGRSEGRDCQKHDAALVVAKAAVKLTTIIMWMTHYKVLHKYRLFTIFFKTSHNTGTVGEYFPVAISWLINTNTNTLPQLNIMYHNIYIMPIVTVSGFCNQLKRKQQKTNYKWHAAGGIKYIDISVRLFLNFQINNAKYGRKLWIMLL